MIGLRAGIKPVPGRQGLAVGLGEDETAPSVTSTTLTIALADSADPVMTQANYDYTAIVANTGAIPATNVSAVIVCPTNSTFVSASGTGWTCSNVGHTVTCTRASLAVGVAPTITITVTSPASAETSSATADADADNTDPAAQDTETTGVLLVAKDAASGKRCPASAAEWSNVGSVVGFTCLPFLLYLCQDAAGGIVDTIGGHTGIKLGSPLYQQAQSGWTRVALELPDNTGSLFINVDSSLPDMGAVSTMALGYVNVFSASVTGASRGIITLGDTGSGKAYDWECGSGNATPAIKADSGAQTSSTGSLNDAVHPYVIKFDRTAPEFRGCTDTDNLTGAYNSTDVSGKVVEVGGGVSVGARHLYYCVFSGASAELTSAQIKTLLQALGWTVTWTP